jgi:hypothetical protein
MREQIQTFLQGLDEGLTLEAAGERLDLYPIGRSALILYHDLEVGPGGTRDFDIVQVRSPSPPLQARALELFGKGTANARRLGLYLELVPAGLPPVPQWFAGRCTEVAGDWQVLRLWRPEPHDLAATKLKSFRPQDRADLRFLCDEGVLHAEALRRSLESAFLWTTDKDGDPDRDRAFANLERVVAYLEGRSRSL